jgi:molecular chaperone GrpE (heat shock protein)
VPWVEGIRLIERKFNKCLEFRGLQQLKQWVKNSTEMHEAVQHVDGEDGMIIQELRKGYKLYDRVIRRLWWRSAMANRMNRICIFLDFRK